MKWNESSGTDPHIYGQLILDRGEPWVKSLTFLLKGAGSVQDGFTHRWEVKEGNWTVSS